MGESDPANSKVKDTDVVVKGAPWWVNAIFKAVAVLGIPGALIAYYAYRDFKFFERGIAVQERNSVIMERVEKILWRMERRLDTADNK